MSRYRLGPHAPCIAEEAFIAPGTHLIGQVTIGAGSSVWFGAVLRGDNAPIVLGARCNVQEGAVLHADPGFALQMGDEVTIGHQAMVLNGAVIGEECLIGAGALVPEGRTFPPRSLILGTPAKVVRPLTEAEVAGLRQSAATYAAKALELAATLERLV
jgi:carbonic anhydrase/acetyltransferase-like protein (isoleucine patch superfamily)